MRSIQRFVLGTSSGLVLASALLVATPRLARAQPYVVYAPAPPPPPPPIAYGYGPYEGVQRPPRKNAFDFGVDLEGAIPVNIAPLPNGNQLQGGSGVKLRFGDQIRLAPAFRLTAEGGYAYDYLFASSSYGNAYSWDVNRFFGGVRLAFGTVVVPSVYAHLGFGWRDNGDPRIANMTGFAADAGGTIDIRVSRRFQLGFHAEYATLDGIAYAPQWVAMGAHTDLTF
jgi:hypothetical protein